MRNSWITQIGVLYILGLPFILQSEKKEALGAVAVAAGLSMTVQILMRKWKNSPLKRVFWTVLRFFGLILALGGLVSVTSWYAEAVEGIWLPLGMLIIALLIGRNRGREGETAMRNLWSKIVIVGIFTVLIFQLPNMTFSYDGPMQVLQWGSALRMGVLLFLVNLPFMVNMTVSEEIEIGNEEEKSALLGKEFFRNFGFVWVIFFLVVWLLIGMWEMEILRIAPHPYMLFGGTGRTIFGTAVRLEALNYMLVVVSLYFSAVSCLDELKQVLNMKQDKKKKKEVVALLVAGLIAGVLCTGCGAKLSEKELVLIGDENKLTGELSSMKVLVVHNERLEKLIPFLLSQPSISYQGIVVYSKEPLDEALGELMKEMEVSDIMDYVEKLTEPVTQMNSGEYVTVRQMLNSCFSGEKMILPQVQLSGEEIKVIGKVTYKNGKLVD